MGSWIVMRVFCNLCGSKIDAKEFVENHAVICRDCAKKTIDQVMKDAGASELGEDTLEIHNAECVCENLKLRPSFANTVLDIVNICMDQQLHPENDAKEVVEKLGLNKGMVSMIPRILHNWRIVNGQ